ncbi:MAG: serine/threonine protein kinase, partial [Acidobacteria bacterium]|nr:serine/threonine protein kinase [Acidobacteriota bacterium]
TRGQVSLRIAIEIGLQMANGLAAAHEKGIVHRDLKPENIFLTRDRRVKILDFGIAKLNAGFGANDGPTFSPAATEPGMVIGTVGYMSPEQVRGEAVDHRSDLFAFGTILYEILSGQRAFKRNSGIETLSAILKEEPPDVSQFNPAVPPALERVVRRCLEKEREQRFQSARDLAFNLDTLSTLSSSSTFSGTGPHPAPAPHAPTGAASGAASGHAGSHLPSSTQATALRSPLPPSMTPTQRSPSMPRPARPTMSGVARPKRRTSPILLGVLFLVLLAGAAFGGWWLATRGRAEASEVAYHRITFRRGTVRAARFGADGDTIVYSAAWDGAAPEVFIATRQAPDARALGIADCDVAAISKNGELAVVLRRDRVTGLGTLARVALAGGLPREMAEGVQQADWSPDGSTLAIIRSAGDKWRVEAPIGTVLYETVHSIRDLRYSPDGTRLAFLEAIQGEFHLTLLDGHKPSTVAKGWPHGTSGLAWSPDASELWVTGTSTAEPPALYAVTVASGDTRLVARLTGSMKLFDISPAGRVLLTTGTWRAALEYQAPGEAAPRDAAWLDWSVLADLSPDGRTILFSEGREGGGAKRAVFLRHGDASMPVRLGDGFADGLSPDGRLALCHTPDQKLVILPTGTGEARELKVRGSFDNGAIWFADNKRVVMAGAVEQHSYQLHVLDTLDETIRAISPENIAGAGSGARPYALSPDGRFVAGLTAKSTIALYPVEGNGAAAEVPGAQPGEVPIAFSPDGAMLYVYRPGGLLPVDVTRIQLATGSREPWKQLSPADAAGVYSIVPVRITPDGSAYAYNALRTLSDLYVAEGLR